MSKSQLQEAQYDFPYHHIPFFDRYGRLCLSRRMTWGLRYVCYQQHIREAVVSLGPSAVLDIGCGDGYFIGNLPTDIPIRVGVDLSERAIAFARAFHPDCVFHACDAADIDDQFDVVLAVEVLEHLADDAVPAFLSTIAARLTAGGTAILSVPTTNIPLVPKHHRHYDRPTFMAQLTGSNAALHVHDIEYVFSKPWWYDLLRWSLNNRFFRLEVRPILHRAWLQIWRKHRAATPDTGHQMVIYLRKAGSSPARAPRGKNSHAAAAGQLPRASGDRGTIVELHNQADRQRGV